VRDLDLNEAIRCYLGVGPSGGITPYGGPERVRERYGSESPLVQRAAMTRSTGCSMIRTMSPPPVP
jgi:hypothetical protein